MKACLKTLIAVVAFNLLAPDATAALIADEPFNYDGTVSTDLNGGTGGTGWASAWSDTIGIGLRVSPGNQSLSYPPHTTLASSGSQIYQTTSGDRSIRTLSTAINPGGATYYMSFLATRLSDASRFRVEFVRSSDSLVRFGVEANADGTVRVQGGTTSANTTVIFTPGLTRLVVVKFSTAAGSGIDNASVKLFDTTNAGNFTTEPATWDATAGSATGVLMDQVWVSMSTASVQFDELRIGTTYPDVVGNFDPTPVAEAGATQHVKLPQNTATLNGSGAAAVGSIVSYQWQQASGPPATLVGANTPTLVATNLVEGVYVFSLTVTDSGGRTNTDSATVVVNAARDAGVFYSTLYAYDPAYRMTRLTNFGVGAVQRLLGDVNGDGKDDAVATFYTNTAGLRVDVALSDGTNFGVPSTWLTWAGAGGTEKTLLGDVTGDGKKDVVFFHKSAGVWSVAVSTGTNFAAPVQWSTGNGAWSDFQFLRDLNGDGKDDAIVSWKLFNSGDWRGGLSDGSTFGAFSIYKQNFGFNQTHFVCDMNGDRKADFISFEPANGNWSIGLNGSTNLLDIETGFVTNAEFTAVYDVDRNGMGDFVYVDGNEAWVRYFTTNLVLIQPRHRWITYGRSRWRFFYPDDTVTALASMDGSGYAQLFCSYNGWWQAFPPNPNKSVRVQGETVNTWETWPNRYLPKYPASQNPNDYGYYDSGDPNVNDAQIRRMHDLGFSYIMFDITNGSVDWVDKRAQAFIRRIRAWNNSLKPGQRWMYFCIALGNTRSTTNQTDFLTRLESECQRAWDEFYSANLDIVYQLHGKPLVIHILNDSQKDFWYSVTNWAGPRTYFDRLTCRTFRQFDEYINDAPYGWIIQPTTPSQDPDLMTVQPGFGNGSTYYPRNTGARYKSHWNQVLQADPKSVFVVSWNEDWENNSIEPTYMNRTPAEAAWMGGEGQAKGYPGLTYWTDELGARMDDYYYEMTRLYLRIFLTGNIYQNTYLKETSSPDVYRAGPTGFIYQPVMPSQTPVLKVPDGFRTSFSGQFLPPPTDAYQFQITDATLAAPNQVNLTFESWSGHQYEIFSGTNLNAVVESQGFITATGRSTTFTKTGVNLPVPRFFRLVDRGVPSTP